MTNRISLVQANSDELIRQGHMIASASERKAAAERDPGNSDRCLLTGFVVLALLTTIALWPLWLNKVWQ